MQGETVEVLCTLAVFGPLRDGVGPAFEAACGCRLVATYEPTAVLLAAVRAGRRAGAMVATEQGVAALADAGVLEAASVRAVGMTASGLGRRPGGPALDIGTPERFLAALRGARRIAVSATGASGIAFRHMLERQRLTAELGPKLVLLPKGFTGEAVMAGQADFAVQQMSELAAVPGLELVGAFPPPFRTEARFAAAVFVGAPAGARRFVGFVSGGSAAAALRAGGVEPA